MTVEELIERLREMPPTALVVFGDDEGIPEMTPTTVRYEMATVIIDGEIAPVHRGFGEPSR